MITYNKEEKIAKILQTTKELIINKGIKFLNIRKISKLAEVSIGTIYRYFPDGIPSIVRDMSINFQETSIFQDFSIIEKSKNFFDIINTIIDKQIFLHKQNIKLLRAFEYIKFQNPEYFDVIQQNLDFKTNNIYEFISKYPQFEKYRKEKLELRINQAFNIIDNAIHQHILYKRVTDTDAEYSYLLTHLFIRCLEIE